MIDLNKLSELVFNTLPHIIDKTSEGEFVKKADLGEEGYAENIEYSLNIILSYNNLFDAYYYGEQDDFIYLDLNLPDKITKEHLEEKFKEIIGKSVSEFF